MGQDVLWALIVAVGVRLVVQDWRARGALAALGMALVLLGTGAAMLAHALDAADPSLATTGLWVLTTGTVLVAWFTQLTFHPGNTWARAAVGACAVVLALGLQHQLTACGLGTGHVTQSPVMAFTRAAVLAWPAVESLRFRRLYARRMALGLADPVVANRFLLFSVWTLALAVMPVWVWLSTTLANVQVRELKSGMLFPVRVLGVVCVLGVLLTFVPPRAYLDLLGRRHARRMGTGAA